MTDRPQQHGLKFYEKSHRYKLDGEWVPGVTTIIKDAVPAPALMKWSAKAVAQYVAANRETVERLWTMGEQATTNALKEVPWAERDRAGVRGTDVHALAELYVQGKEIEVPDHLVGHVEACADFIDDWNIRPVLVEACVGSREHQYAGKLDLVADSNRAPRAIFDWKTAASGIFFETAFQCVGYGFAEFHGEDGNESPMTDLNIEAAFGVHLRADGYDVYPLRYGKDVFDEFVALRCHAAVLKRAKGDWKNPGSGYVGRAVNPDLEGVVA
jgi:hypothetical protein